MWPRSDAIRVGRAPRRPHPAGYPDRVPESRPRSAARPLPHRPVALSLESHRCNSSTACGKPARAHRRDDRPPKGTQELGSTVVHPPPHPHRVLDARRGGAGERPRAGGGRGRAARPRDHRPRQHVRGPRLLRRLPQGRHQPGHRHRGLHGRRVAPRAAGAAGQGGRHRRRHRRGREALLPPDPPGRVERGLPQPAEALVGRLPRGLLLQAPPRLGAAGAPRQGTHRHDGLPRRGRPPGPAGRRPGEGRDAGGAPAGHLRQGQPLRRGPGPRPARAAQDQPRPGRDRPPHRRPAPGHQRQPLHPPRGPRRPRRPAVRADRRPHGRPQAVQVRGRGALPEVRRRDAAPLRRAARGVRQHPPHRRARQRRDRLRQAEPAPVPGARRVHRRHLRGPGRRLPPPPQHRGGEGALWDAHPGRGDGTARLRARGHRQHGLLGLLPRGVGPDPLRPLPAHPGGPGPRLGRRMLRRLLPPDRRPRPDPLRPALRALPQSRAHPDARHRHGLRRALPRRHDQVRGRALRVGPRGPDRHLLHHQGPGRRARRVPGARLPVHRGRQDRQGHAAAADGPGHPAGRLPGQDGGLRGGVPARRRAPDHVRDRPRGQAGHRRGQGARGHAPGRRDPRRRRGHHRPAAHRVRPHPAQAGQQQPRRRPDRHPVRDARGRGPRPAQDGLPRACATCR